jgi:hypothetical protein
VNEDDGPAEQSKSSANDVGAFLAVFAALLLDNVVRLEETVGSVTDLVMGNGHPSREMIVTLQNFDRLKQEFESLGDALTRYAEAANKSSDDVTGLAALERNVISGITVADLKDRLLSRLQDDMPNVIRPQISEQELSLVGVDVIY